ncbi:hypothetical protein ENSA5_00610 [Enhygromyxa salina]|uniref:Uncharacterized protein n=2 Tax=Enhygromyxa salina TaxID=215803 RepID=A0A2S9YKV9_9BACT|nr:hypothetical protein ENSA5_00610 [Enhygromyxa salina]
MRRIRSFPDDVRLRVLDKITRGAQNAIARTRSDEWLPVEHVIEVCDALVDVLERERAVEFWRDLVYDSWVGGLLEPLSHSLRDHEDGTRARGEAVLALAPAAWSISARNCGEIVVVPDDDGGRLRLEARGLPDVVEASVGIRVMYAGAIKAMLVFAGLGPSVKINDAGGQFAFSLTFTSPT